MKIRVQLFANSVLSITLACVIFASVAYLSSEIERDFNDSRAFHQVMVKAFALNALGDHYLVNPIERVAEQWSMVHESMGVLLARLLPDHEGEEPLLSSLTRTYREIGGIFGKFREARNRKGGSEGGFDLSERLSGLLSVKLQRMVDDSSRLFEASQKRALDFQRKATLITYALVTAMILLSGVIMLVLNRRIIGSLTALEEGAQRVAEGDLDGRIDVRTEDELGSLARQFNVMTEKLGESMRRLENEVEQRRRIEGELKLYSRMLEQSNRELQDFASVASHDLQEPLRKIQVFGDKLRARVGPNLDEDADDYLDRMQKAAVRMQKLIEALLGYARVSKEAQSFDEVDLGLMVREVSADLEAALEESGGRLEVGPLPRIRANESQMRQLFQNLIGNALKYHGADPPVVRIREEGCASPDAPVRTCSVPVCRVFVEDNGIGFDERHVDRIFAPFQRLHGKDRYPGTGMGLAICRKIVERHGGSLTATSTPGQGATFIVTLPESRVAWRSPVAEDSPPAPVVPEKTAAR